MGAYDDSGCRIDTARCYMPQGHIMYLRDLMGHIKPKGGIAFLTGTAPTSAYQGRSHVYLTLGQIYILLHL